MSEGPGALICLDMDGTSVDHDGLHCFLSPLVARALNRAADVGAAWCTNSGRSADNQVGVIQACRELNTMPQAIASGERYIHDIHETGFGAVPRQEHNRPAREKALALMALVTPAVEGHGERLLDHADVAEWHPSAEFAAWLLTERADPLAFAELAAQCLQSVPQAKIIRNGRWIVVTHVDFGKGWLLEKIAAGLGVPREGILAVGDQHNDLDMLDGNVAGYVGCPADADPVILETVRAAGGWIAEQPGSAGTAALIDRFVGQVL